MDKNFKGDYDAGTSRFHFMALRNEDRHVDTDLNSQLLQPYKENSGVIYYSELKTVCRFWLMIISVNDTYI